MNYPLVMMWEWIPMDICLFMYRKLLMPSLLYSNPDWAYIPHQKTKIIVHFIIVAEIHAPSDSTYILSHIRVSPQYLHMSSSNFGVLLSGAIFPATP